MKKDLIVKDYKKDGNNYTVEYLDGSITAVSSVDDAYDQSRIETILDLTKDGESVRHYSLNKNTSELLAASAVAGFVTSAIYDHKALAIASAFIAGYGLCSALSYRKRINEMKKFKMFLEMHQDLDTVNKSDFLKCIEFDNFYQIPLTEKTVECYPYGQVRTLYKKYKKEVANKKCSL